MLVQQICFPLSIQFWQFCIALVGTGLYLAALANTANVMMTPSLKATQHAGTRLYQRYLATSRRYANVAYAISSLMGGTIVWLGGISLPYRLQPIVAVCMLIVACFTKSPKAQAGAKHAGLQTIRKVLRMMFVDRRDIRYLLMLYAVQRLHMMLCFWLIQPRMALAGIPRWMYGVVYAVWGLTTGQPQVLRSMRGFKRLYGRVGCLLLRRRLVRLSADLHLG